MKMKDEIHYELGKAYAENAIYNTSPETLEFEKRKIDFIHDARNFDFYSGYTKAYHTLIYAILEDKTLTLREQNILFVYIRLAYGCWFMPKGWFHKQHLRSVYITPADIRDILGYRTNDSRKTVTSLLNKGWFDAIHYTKSGRLKLSDKKVVNLNFHMGQKAKLGWRNAISRAIGFDLVVTKYSTDPFKLSNLLNVNKKFTDIFGQEISQ